MFEDEIFDFFMNQETAVESDPATLFFSSCSNLSPSISEENDHSQADPMLSTMKANMSRIGQLMDSLAVRARIVSDSEMQNLRKEASSKEPLPRDKDSGSVSTHVRLEDGAPDTCSDERHDATTMPHQPECRKLFTTIALVSPCCG